jgi:hypothetical protein
MESNGNNRRTAYLAHETPDAAAHLSDTQFAALQLLHYVQLLWSRWLLIVVATIGAGLGYGLFTKYLAVKFYRAQAVIAPISSDPGLGSMSAAGDMMDNMGGGLMSLFNLAGGGDTATVAQRYLSIMNSYAFTTDLINRYHLERKIVGVRSKSAPTVTRWSMHRDLTSRFTSEYDYRSGNLTLYFLDPSPEDAQRILAYYLDSLRDKLRNEEVQSAAAAAVSLQDEIRKTSDALLQTQLYELMARQVQREKVAQVQADFAFKVIEPPVVPDNYYAPSARKNATLAAAITFALLCAWIIGADFLRRARSRLDEIQQIEIQQIEDEQEQPRVPDSPSDASGESSPRFVRTLRPRG